MKDWIGNKTSVMSVLGARNYAKEEREVNDFYATDPNALEVFLKALERDNIELHSNIWECACGQGHLAKVLEEHNYQVISSDLIDRGYGRSGVDFLKCKGKIKSDILTNPPYKIAKEFVEKAMSLLEDGYYCVMFLKIQFLEGQARHEMFKSYPPIYIYQ